VAARRDGAEEVRAVQRRPSVIALDGTVVVGQVAALLADLGQHALPTALEALVSGLGLRSAVLRSTGGGDLLAVAGDVVHAVPVSRSIRPLAAPGSLVEVPVRSVGREAAVLVVDGARPSQLPVLRAVASAFGLVLAQGTSRQEDPVDAELVDDAEADRDAVADALHDGLVQSLVVARYAVDAVVRAGDPTGSAAIARDAVQSALVDVRRMLWQLRPRGADGLHDALAQLSQRQLEVGAPALDLDEDPEPLDALSGAVAVTAYRLVQAVLGPDSAVRVRADAAALEVTGGLALPDPERWQRRAAAVGAELEVAPGRLRLVLPGPDPEPPSALAAPAADLPPAAQHPAALPTAPSTPRPKATP
jgi:signal transduction histidine kinase